MEKTGKIAIVRIRGVRNIKPEIKRTLELLRLSRPHHCVVVDLTPQTMGMIRLIGDYVAFGAVTQDTIEKLIVKRGEKGAKNAPEVMKAPEIKAAAEKIAKGAKVKEFVDPVFRLHPPRKGYRDIKMQYPQGDLGKRPDMDDLLKRMM